MIYSNISAFCINHYFLTLLGFRNIGERTTWVSGAFQKRADTVTGVAGQVFRAAFRAGDSHFFSFNAFRPIGYAPNGPWPKARQTDPLFSLDYVISSRFRHSDPFTR